MCAYADMCVFICGHACLFIYIFIHRHYACLMETVASVFLLMFCIFKNLCLTVFLFLNFMKDYVTAFV